MISASDLIGLGFTINYMDDGAPAGWLMLPPVLDAPEPRSLGILVYIADGGRACRVNITKGPPLDASGAFELTSLDHCRPTCADDLRLIVRAFTMNSPSLCIPAEPPGKLRLLQESIEFVRIVTGPPRAEPDLRGDGVQYRCPLCQETADHPNAVPHQLFCVHHPSIPRLSDWADKQ